MVADKSQLVPLSLPSLLSTPVRNKQGPLSGEAKLFGGLTILLSGRQHRLTLLGVLVPLGGHC